MTIDRLAAHPKTPTRAEAVKFRGEISNLSEVIGAALRKRERDHGPRNPWRDRGRAAP